MCAGAYIKQKRKRQVVFSAPSLKKVPVGLKEKKKKGNGAPLHWIEVKSTKQRDD